MMELLKFLNARFGEASTYASISAMLLAVHVNLDPGAAKQLMLYGMIASGGISVLLAEAGAKPGSQVAQDVMAAILAGIKTVPETKALLAFALFFGLTACQPNTTGAALESVGLAAAGVPAPAADLLIVAGAQAGQLYCAANGQRTVAVNGATVNGLAAVAVAAMCPPGAVPVPAPPGSVTVPVVQRTAS